MGCAAGHSWELRAVFLVGFTIHGEYVCAVCGVVTVARPWIQVEGGRVGT